MDAAVVNPPIGESFDKLSLLKIKNENLIVAAGNTVFNYRLSPAGNYDYFSKVVLPGNNRDLLFFGKFWLYSNGEIEIAANPYRISDKPIEVFAVSPSQSRLAIVLSDVSNQIKVWDIPKLESHALANIFITHVKEKIKSMAFLPSEKYFVTGHVDGNIKFWDIEDKKGLSYHTIQLSDQPVVSLTVIPQVNRLVAGTADGKVFIVDLDEVDNDASNGIEVNTPKARSPNWACCQTTNSKNLTLQQPDILRPRSG